MTATTRACKRRITDFSETQKVGKLLEKYGLRVLGDITFITKEQFESLPGVDSEAADAVNDLLREHKLDFFDAEADLRYQRIKIGLEYINLKNAPIGLVLLLKKVDYPSLLRALPGGINASEIRVTNLHNLALLSSSQVYDILEENQKSTRLSPKLTVDRFSSLLRTYGLCFKHKVLVG